MLQPAFHSPEKTNVAFLHQDTQYRKIFVGGLPYHTTDESLRDYFLVFGEIEEAVVITDRQTGKSKGYGFVTMTDAAAADRACKDPNPIIDGRKANVNLAYIGAKPRNNTSTGVTALRPVQGAIVPVASPFATSYSILPQPQIGHYVPQSSFFTPFAGLVSDVNGSTAVSNVYANAYGNVHPSTPSLPTAYILPTIPTQPGIQIGAMSSLPTSGLTYTSVVSQNDVQNQTVVSGTMSPTTNSHLVAQLQEQTVEKQ